MHLIRCTEKITLLCIFLNNLFYKLFTYVLGVPLPVNCQKQRCTCISPYSCS